MTILTLRQKQILSFARKQGSVIVDSLAEQFEVTPQTIRKDLNELCDSRHLTRTHGGAMLSSGVENLAYDSRRQFLAEEKQTIARRAASLIPNNTSLFINIGTTTEEVAKALIHHEGLMVITNNIHVAQILLPHSKIEVILVGGTVRSSDGGIVGEQAVEAISQFKVDIAVMGVSAIDDDGALLDFDVREVRAARAIMSNSRQIFLVADNTKFTRTAPVRIAHISQIDRFITDEMPPDHIIEVCKNNSVQIEVAGMAESEAGTMEHINAI